MAPGEAGAALTGVADTAGTAVSAGQSGDYGTMGAAITNVGGTATSAAGYDEIGSEITDWGGVAGNATQAGLDNGDVGVAFNTALSDGSNVATKYQTNGTPEATAAVVPAAPAPPATTVAPTPTVA